jgi:hypothetical protein
MNLELASLPWQNRTAWNALFAVLAFFGSAGVSSAKAHDNNPLRSSRLPRTNLLVYHGRNGEVLPVRSKSDWQKRRAEILRGFEEVAGVLPGREKRCALDVLIEERKDCGSYEQRLITYSSEPGSRVPAYLLIPKDALESHKRFPAVLCLHPTDSEFGNRVVVEKLRDYYPAYARELAERGFVTLSPAYPLLANYQPALKALGWQSGTLKAVWDNIRGLDLLDSLSFVKHGKYGASATHLAGITRFTPRSSTIASALWFPVAALIRSSTITMATPPTGNPNTDGVRPATCHGSRTTATGLRTSRLIFMNSSVPSRHDRSSSTRRYGTKTLIGRAWIRSS